MFNLIPKTNIREGLNLRTKPPLTNEGEKKVGEKRSIHR